MTNLNELFEIFNGQNLTEPINQTIGLFRTYRKASFVDLMDSITPISKFLDALQSDQHPLRITDGAISLSLYILERHVKDGSISNFIQTATVIRSEMMGCANLENFTEVKELYSFWEGIELSLKNL